jgi:cytochrome c biogenesis protein CcmG/thiol:disulfide interchange protein DsbE
VITGGHPRYGLSAPGSPWVQELDGPLGIKAFLTTDSYSLNVKSNCPLPRSRLCAALALSVTLAALALSACGSSDSSGNPDSRLSVAEATAPLEGAPAPLAAIRADANQILDGGSDAFGERIDQLHGFPVVVNDWASWCGPCRFEFPFFQSQASKHAKEVAFLGADSDDSKGAAEQFLSELPLPYPSYSDEDLAIRREISAIGYPATAFYDGTGELVYTHQGQYRTEADLAADINRYALGSG